MFINYAHRGASAYYPENTLSAFYAGLEMGANGIETDIQRTKDGVLVLFHDDTIERVTEGTGAICEHTYEELSKLFVKNQKTGRIDKILKLEDFLKYFAFRDLTFAIELKQDHVEKETIDMLDAYGMRDKTILTSFNYESLKNAKAYNPAYRVGYLYEADEKDAVNKVQAIHGEELCPEAELMDAELVQIYKNMGFSVRVWGIYNPDIMKAAYNMGVDGMTVNFPDILTEYINNKSMEKEGM